MKHLTFGKRKAFLGAVVGVVAVASNIFFGATGMSEAQTASSVSGCVASVSRVWSGNSFSTQTGVMVFTSYVTPSDAGTEGVIGLGPISPSGYGSLAAAVHVS